MMKCKQLLEVFLKSPSNYKFVAIEYNDVAGYESNHCRLALRSEAEVDCSRRLPFFDKREWTGASHDEMGKVIKLMQKAGAVNRSVYEDYDIDVTITVLKDKNVYTK